MSRGARFAVFVDRDRECSRIIKENLKHTKLEEKGEVITGQVISTIKKFKNENRKFDIIFIDPPYQAGVLEETIAEISNCGILKEDGIIVAEHDVRHNMPEIIENLSVKDRRKYGDTIISFYRIGRY